jgi:hypothetical protein
MASCLSSLVDPHLYLWVRLSYILGLDLANRVNTHIRGKLHPNLYPHSTHNDTRSGREYTSSFLLLLTPLVGNTNDKDCPGEKNGDNPPIVYNKSPLQT